MENSKLFHVCFVSRLLLGFLFMYHGLVPKILWLSAAEVHLVNASGIGISAEVISPLAGVGEMLLGGAIIFMKQSIIPVYIAGVVLFFLLVYVGIKTPEYLVDAFNPVTTNILGLGFCYLIIFTSKQGNG